ncbi:IS66 family transposase [Bradyrhizobium elkanii]|uniref:IS66 family transposase n=1 Tax=Bradyrhizobium elkanii TaxID=29448 RepID=A0A4U6RWG0_BRAEL|nr:IS66 family transposase [Bradyrhizobium elkanii]
MLRRSDRFARFIDDGRICLTNNAAERALRGFALGRKSWLFAGSERGVDPATTMATLIITAKFNDVDPQAWLADVLARIVTPQQVGSMSYCLGNGRGPPFSLRPDRAIAPRDHPAALTGLLRLI